jgi:Cu+-exporting ATPase
VVDDGISWVDESLLTGESAPVEKKTGASVVGGSLNTTGSIIFRATAVGANTALARIAALVEEAGASKPPVQKLADRISGVFVPIVLSIAAVTFAVWKLSLHAPLSLSLSNSIAVLVIACPCALGLATPVAVIVSIGRAASQGILVRSASAIEQASRIKMILFDKTGALTFGKFAVEKIVAANGFSENELLQYAASADSASEHPVATSIVKYAKDLGVALLPVEEFNSQGGMGANAKVSGKEIAVGSPRYLSEKGISLDQQSSPKIEGTLACVSCDGVFMGAIILSDRLRPEAKETISSLKSMGIQIAIASGDSDSAVQSVAYELGIDRWSSKVLPKDKANLVNEYRAQIQNGVIAMVGDGVNDAPALASADIGIAMATASDAATGASDLSLISSDLTSIIRFINLSEKAMAIIRQNLFWAFAFNSIGIPLAFTGHLSPMIGSFAMAMSSVIVVTNSLRLKRG